MSDTSTQTVERLEDQDRANSRHSMVKLLPDQITAQWDGLVKQSIMMSLPTTVPVTEEVLSNVLSALLAGRLICWVLTRDGKVMAMTTTAIVVDSVSGVRNLLVYSIAAFSTVSDATWRWVFVRMARYARRAGCYKITACTNNSRVLDIVKKLGGKTNVRLIELEV